MAGALTFSPFAVILCSLKQRQIGAGCGYS